LQKAVDIEVDLVYNTNMMKNKRLFEMFGNFVGWIGMILIHGATLPVTIKNIMGTVTVMPPVEMVLMVWGGLFLFLIRAIVNKDTLYIVSNAIGFFFNTVLLALIVFKGV
jgi:uncharacterized protein with PQ loop repeat